MKKRIKKVVFWFLGVILILTVSSVAYSFNKIKNSVVSVTEVAKSEYPGDAVEALISYINSDSSTIKEKNRAIWALGQFADDEALPFLKQIYTSEDNKYQELSKYEIEKAIKWCEKGNLTSWMYKEIKK